MRAEAVVWCLITIFIVNLTIFAEDHSPSFDSRKRPFARTQAIPVLSLADACSPTRPGNVSPTLPPPPTPVPPSPSPIAPPNPSPVAPPSPSPVVPPVTLPSIPPPVTPVVPPASPIPAKTVEEFMEKNCRSCHSPQDPLLKKRIFHEDGTPKRLLPILDVLEAKPGSREMNSIMKGIREKMHESEKQMLDSWVRQKRIETGTVPPVISPPPLPPPPSIDLVPNPDVFGKEAPSNEIDANETLKQSLTHITPKALKEKMDQKKAPVILYVGTSVKQETAHPTKIKGAHEIGTLLQNDPEELLASVQRLEALEQKMGPDFKKQEIVVYCSCCMLIGCEYTWNAVWFLKRRGYEKITVIDFRHDYDREWKRENYPTEPLTR